VIKVPKQVVYTMRPYSNSKIALEPSDDEGLIDLDVSDSLGFGGVVSIYCRLDVDAARKLRDVLDAHLMAHVLNGGA